MDITNTNKIPKNTFVLKIAKALNAFAVLFERICVNVKIMATKITNVSNEKIPIAEVITKNQNENPIDTVNALKRGEDISI